MERIKLMASIFILATFTLSIARCADEARAPPEPCEPVKFPDQTDWRRNLRDCPDGVELWECIRDAMHRRDI